MAGPRSLQHSRRAGSVDEPRGHRHLRSQRGSSAAGSPDLAAAAREAVVGFLHDSSMGAPPPEPIQLAGTTSSAKGGTSAVAEKAGAAEHVAAVRVDIPSGMAPLATGAASESVAMRAAALSVATLDRIEAAAAKVEADIRSALQAQAELQAGAGAAAEAAVRAAEQSWMAAHTSVAAEGRARVILGVMTRYLAVTIALVVITLIFLIITASIAH
jgi:hypothetical protein